MQIATIDLGTNTCHLLIAQIKSNDLDIKYQETTSVKLGQNGIDENIITKDAFQRTIETFIKYHTVCKKYQVDKIYATATAAVRMAINKADLISKIYEITGISLNVISGDKEASLIHEGIRLALPEKAKTALMMDIGGGSVEFIITKNKNVEWQRSYNTGAALLLKKFNPSDPINIMEKSEIIKYLENEWSELLDIIKINNIDNFIGSSGSFETICDLHYRKLNSSGLFSSISFFDFKKISTQLFEANRTERLLLPGMQALRVDMIILAIIMIRLIADALGSKIIYYSNFALKEGLSNLLLNFPENRLVSDLLYSK